MFKTFKARMGIYSPHDQNQGNRMQDSFNIYFDGWRKQFVEVIYNDLRKEELECIIQDINIGNRGETADEKVLITKLDKPMTNGTQIWWRDRMWMVVNREIRSVATHEQAKLRELNTLVKWTIDDKGTICGNGEGQWVFVENLNTQFALGNTRIADYARFADDNLGLYVQDNEESRALTREARLFVNERPYSVLMKNVTTRPGIIELLLKESFDNPETDDVENQVANIRPELPREEEDTGSINGSNTIKLGSVERFEIETDNIIDNIFVSDINRAIEITSQSSSHIELRSIRDYRLMGSTITINVLYDNGNTSSKTVTIIAPM